MDGRFFDLGRRSLESSKVVAAEWNLRLVIQQSYWLTSPSATAVRLR